MQKIDHQSALVYIMVLASAADARMSDSEIQIMSDMIKILPVFDDYDLKELSPTAQACTRLLEDPEGIEKALDLVEVALPPRLKETAYALACDIVAADGNASQEELALLELLRDRLAIGSLAAAAIEYGAAARFRQV